MLDRCYKINNTWIGFDKDLENLAKSLNKNQFLTKLIKKAIKSIWIWNLTKGHLKTRLKWREIYDFSKFSTFCKGIDVEVVLTPFKSSNKFSYKDPLPFHLQSFIVYKFVCANCKVCYVGETTRHFITRINEHLQKDAKSNIFKHLRESRVCNSVCNKDCFSVIDQATTEYQLKMKEAMHIKWIRPKLNKQVKHYTLSLIV